MNSVICLIEFFAIIYLNSVRVESIGYGGIGSSCNMKCPPVISQLNPNSCRCICNSGYVPCPVNVCRPSCTLFCPQYSTLDMKHCKCVCNPGYVSCEYGRLTEKCLIWVRQHWITSLSLKKDADHLATNNVVQTHILTWMHVNVCVCQEQLHSKMWVECTIDDAIGLYTGFIFVLF
jgi:hypothetical protein